MFQLILGEQSLLLDRTINNITKKFLDEVNDFNLIHFDLERESIDLLLDEVNMPSFMSDHKVVIAKNPYFFLEKSSKKDNNTNYDEFIKYLDRRDEDVMLILICQPSYINQNNKIYKAAYKACNPIDLTITDQTELRRYTISLLENSKIKMSEDALKEFVLRCDSVSKIEGELAKLSLLEKEISKEDVMILVPKSIENNIFELSNALLKHNRKDIARIYNDFKTLKIEPSSLIGMLANSYRLMLNVYILNKMHKSVDEMATILNVNPYRIKLSKEYILNYEEVDLENILIKLSDLDQKIKSGEKDRFIDFEIFLTH